MSEQKRATLTSIGTNKKDKKSKEVLKTVRFTLGLPESNEEACPEFHYSALLNSAERKRKAKLKTDGQVNGIDPLGEDDDHKLKEIAKQFEEKYGGGGKKKHGRYEDYVDLGAGYDETDPFIDNTDAYDEVVPEEMTTAHGGFYINCGALEFKEVSDQSDAEEIKDLKTKKRFKRIAPIIEDDDEADGKKISNNVEAKKPKLEENKEHEEELLKKRKIQSHDREILKKKKKRAIDDLVKKKSVTVKDLLKEKRESLELDAPSGAQPVPEQRKPTSASPVNASKPSNNTSITDIIESVVSAAREDETSKDSASSVSKSGSLVSSDSEEESQEVEDKEKTTSSEEVKLPDSLQEDFKELINALKKRASESSAEGKCKFFSSDVNSMLLRVELKCRTLTCSNRQVVYGHLASYLPCTKDTLMKRAKKLLIKDEEDKILEPMKKLKNAVDRMMPAVLENYSKECQKAAEEKGIEELPSAGSDSEAGEGEKTTAQKSKVPRRKFPWTDEVRTLLCEVVRIKMQCLELAKPRKESADLYLKNFLEAEVKPLWQPGWMKVSTLLRESRDVHANAVLKQKKTPPVKKLTAAPPSSLGGLGNVTVQAITSYPQAPTANSNVKMKTSTPVSISVTPVPSGSSTSQVPNTAKMKQAASSESSVVFQHSVPANVAVRTKCPLPSPNINSQAHAINSSANVPASLSSSYISSNIRSAPPSTNSSKFSSSQLVTTIPTSSRKKPGGDITIAKILNSSGKGSASSSNNNFQPEKQQSAASVKQKLNTERISPKTIDLSPSNVNRPITVSSVPGSPNKTKVSETNSTPVSVQKTLSLTSLPLMNIPDCISVTPSLPSPSLASSVTTTVSPPTISTPKSMMSLKQRILHDTNFDQSVGSVKVNPSSLGMKGGDDSIEVIEIVKDSRKVETVKATPKVTRTESVIQSKPEARKKKKEPELPASSSSNNIAPSSVEKASVVNATAVTVTSITTCSSTTVTTVVSTNNITATCTSAPLASTPAPANLIEKEVERLLKEEEETAAAADFLLQINESLKNFTHTPSNLGNRDIFPSEDRSVSSGQETPHSDSPKVDAMSSPSVSSPLCEQKGNPSFLGDEKDKLCNSKMPDLKNKSEQSSTPQDDEESVQMEVDRVMKELQELQGQLIAEKSRSSMGELDYSPPKAVLSPKVLDYSPPKTVISPKGLPSTTNCSTVLVNPSVKTQQKSNKSYMDSAMALPLVTRRPSTGNSDLAKMSYGFQDEFQKHLFQETLGKQSETETPNSSKGAKSKAPTPTLLPTPAPTPALYSQINQTAVHSSGVSSRQSQNSSLDGCVVGSQSRNRSESNSTIHFSKLMSANMDPFAGASFLSRMPGTFTPGLPHLQDLKSNAHMPQTGSSQHSPPY